MLKNITNDDKVYISPEGLRVQTNSTLKLGSSILGFDLFKVFVRNDNETFTFNLTLEGLLNWAKKNKRIQEIEEKIHLILIERRNLHEISFKRPNLMGVVNVTPDSFSDGGDYLLQQDAVKHGESLISEGANIVDIGGQSTRPGSEPVSYIEERNRIIRVVESLEKKTLVSVDTNKSKIMDDVIDAGARIINDISALTNNHDSIEKICSTSCGVILMHSQGAPKDMQTNPQYDDVILDIFDYLENRIKVCAEYGIDRSRLIIDPGIGFGKNDNHLRRIMKNISLFHSLGCPLLLGSSRKSFIGRWSRMEKEMDRLGGSISSVLWSLSQGVQVFRVHDVKDTLQAVKIWMRIAETET